MSKEDFTKFKCDVCGKFIVVESGSGFPYRQGWRYLYNFAFKFDEHIFQGIEKDKHFCSVSCMVEFITNMIDKMNHRMVHNG